MEEKKGGGREKGASLPSMNDFMCPQGGGALDDSRLLFTFRIRGGKEKEEGGGKRKGHLSAN